MKVLSVIIVLVFGTSACKTIPKIVHGITVPNMADAAVVLGQGKSGSEFFAFLTGPILGSRYSAIIDSIDDQKVKPTAKGRQWWLDPGKHTIKIQCGFIIGAPTNNDYVYVDIEMDFEKNHIYQLKCAIQSRQWRAFVYDVTED